jgi:hypothetical protein
MPESRAMNPNGDLNCGLAHGVPGPLALMSLALLQGVEVSGMRAAIGATADWLCEHRLDDEWGPNWPYSIPAECVLGSAEHETAVATGVEIAASRSAWCYGAPGVARALWLAGEALGRDDLRTLATTAVRSALAKPHVERGIPSPTFCHGIAGFLQIALRFANDSPSYDLDDGAAELCEQLLTLYDPSAPLGYRSLERDGQLIDNPGLLDGAPGVALVLLAAATNVEPTWDRLFLLS